MEETNNTQPTQEPANQPATPPPPPPVAPAPTTPTPQPANNNDTYVLAVSDFGLFGKNAYANTITNKPVALALLASGKIIAFNGKGETTEEFMASAMVEEKQKPGVMSSQVTKLMVNNEPRAFVGDSFMRKAKEAHKVLAQKHPEYQFAPICELGLMFFVFLEGFNQDPVKTTQEVKNVKPEDLEPEKVNLATIQKDTGLDLSFFGMLFGPEHKTRSLIIAIIGVPILLFFGVAFYNRSSGPNLAAMQAYDLKVKSAKVDTGFRQTTSLLIYTEPPLGVRCESVVLQTPLLAYRDEASRPKAGDTIKVYIEPTASCTRNGLYLSGYTEKNSTESSLDSITNIMLISAALFSALVLLFGAIYSSSQSVREFYLSHSYIGKFIAILFFGWIAISFGMRILDFSSLGWWSAVWPFLLAIAFYLLRRRR
ncbi:MAG: hypothetical protein QG553_580 [Patescibacteria group bacterium]|nr:hypothetical protein [Patescibacteria group bacterium]